MDIYNLVTLGRKFAAMGWAVHDQMDNVICGEIDKCNPSAVKEIIAFVKDAQKRGAEDCEDLLEEMKAFVDGRAEG